MYAREVGLLGGKVALVTGAGRGIGRGEAILLAREGATVVVNDVGTSTGGEGSDSSLAEQVVKEIRESGGQALPDQTDVADYASTKLLLDRVVAEFGTIDIVVNNAGILRDRMIFNMEESEWDAVISVHLKGTFNLTRHAAHYWRSQHKAGKATTGRIINTTSPTGLYGNVGQSNYGAAKGGIASMTVIAAMELSRFNVTVNAVSPSARTRMTEQAFGTLEAPEEGFDQLDPNNIAPVVAYLASDDAASITGQVFSVRGGNIALMQGWTPQQIIEKDSRWEPGELFKAFGQLIPGKKLEPDAVSARIAAGQQPLGST